MQKGTGTSVTAHKFEAWLVGLKCENYCVGFVRGPAATCEAAAKKFTDGSCWLLSKVSLDIYMAFAYIFTPVAVRVDLGKSTVESAGTFSGVRHPAVHPVLPLRWNASFQEHLRALPHCFRLKINDFKHW